MLDLSHEHQPSLLDERGGATRLPLQAAASVAPATLTGRPIGRTGPRQRNMPARPEPKEPVVGTQTVLVIEDDLALSSMLQMALEDAGYRVITAGNGQEGLDAAAREVPDLIVLDLSMPVMDGRAFGRAWRSGPHPDVPIIVITAREYDEQIAAEVQPARWLGKPFDLVQLLDDVARLINRPDA